MSTQNAIDQLIGSVDPETIVTKGSGPAGSLPLNEQMLTDWSSGDLFGMTQNAGMGWDPNALLGPQFLLLSTQGGIRAEDGSPTALGYHTGHWEVGLLVQEAARQFSELGGVPFAAFCSDPCDGRSQGTNGMFDSLPFRNDAAIVLRRLIRSLPTRKGVMGVATCDKGLPAMMMSLVSMHDLPTILVPGGVTLPPLHGEDAGKVQTIGARFSHGEISLQEAASAGCRACGSSGGGCQFFGTAATAQVVGEALGLALPHSALAPSGQPIWLQIASQSAQVLWQAYKDKLTTRKVVTDKSIHNAMAVHAAMGGSTNLLLHIPAIAHAAGLQRPTIDQWNEINRKVPRFVDVLPNGPRNHFTVQVYLAGGVPEVMLQLRDQGHLELDAMTISGITLGDILDQWENSERRRLVRNVLESSDGIDPNDVILPVARAKERGLTSTVCFPQGNLCPDGAVIKATSIDPTVVDDDGVYRKEGPARVFVSERDAIAAVKGKTDRPIKAGDVIVLIGRGPIGSGMEETYQITSALKYLKFGKQVALITDARFSGVSTGACIGHMAARSVGWWTDW